MSGKTTLGEITVLSEHIEWRIGNIFAFTMEDKSYSSTSLTLMSCDCYFKIQKNVQGSCAGWLSFFLTPVSLMNRAATFCFGINSIKKCDGTNHKMSPNISWIFDEGGCGYPQFLKISELTERKTELAPLDNFTITCTFWGYDDFDSTASK